MTIMLFLMKIHTGYYLIVLQYNNTNYCIAQSYIYQLIVTLKQVLHFNIGFLQPIPSIYLFPPINLFLIKFINQAKILPQQILSNSGPLNNWLSLFIPRIIFFSWVIIKFK